jgi:type I restriction enzyme, S subunit
MPMSMINGWAMRRLDQVGTIHSGATPSTLVSSFWNGNIVWITPNDLSKLNTPYIHDSFKRITEKGLGGSSRQLLPPRSVVISSRAPIGYVALPTVEFCSNQGCKSIRLKDDYSPEFTYYNVLFHIDSIKNKGEGTTFAEISKTALSSVVLPFPTSKLEQERISEVLLQVDRAIEVTQATLAKQQRIKTGLMQALLTRGIDVHGDLRSEQNHQFQDTFLGRIPADWKVTTLDECVRNDAPICYGILMPGTGFIDGVPVIKVKDIQGGRVLTDQLLLTDPRIDSQYKRSRLRSGDLLVTIRGSTGRIAVVPPALDGANITQDTARIRLKEEHFNQFFYFLMQGKAVQDQIQLHTLGQAVKGINISEVKRLAFGVPKLDEQRRIADRLSRLESVLVTAELELNKLRSLKTALMQDLLTGRKPVTPLLSPTEDTPDERGENP